MYIYIYIIASITQRIQPENVKPSCFTNQWSHNYFWGSQMMDTIDQQLHIAVSYLTNNPLIKSITFVLIISKKRFLNYTEIIILKSQHNMNF